MSVLRRILIVDDDERVLFVLHHTLMRMGNEYEVVTAHGGREALDRFGERPFDLIITDLRMPDMDGLELTEGIRSLGSSVAVIWITAYGCHKVRDEAARLAVCACLDKPLEIAEIRQAVREALGTTEDQSPSSTSSSTKNT
jgi:two-component system response regulator GlrR